MRPTASNAIDWALSRVVEAMTIAPETIFGYEIAHCRTCMPPIEPPMTPSSRRTPSLSKSSFWTSTISAIVMIGKSRPYGLPVAGLISDGPVVPEQLPMTFEQITKYLSVSMGLPGPTMMSHQPGLRSPGALKPATWALPLRAWQIRTALSCVSVSVP